MSVARTTSGENLRKIIRIPDGIEEMLDREQTLKALAYTFYSYEIPRRQVPGWISERIDHFDGEILFANGESFKTYPGEAYDAFGDEPSMRWISDLYRYLDRLPKQKPHAKVRHRMLLLIVAMMIEHCFIQKDRWQKAWGWWPGLSFGILESEGTVEARLGYPPTELAEHTMTCIRRCPLLDLAEASSARLELFMAMREKQGGQATAQAA
jgi:hypothetical protein